MLSGNTGSACGMSEATLTDDQITRLERLIEANQRAADERMTRLERAADERMTRLERVIENNQHASDERMTRSESHFTDQLRHTNVRIEDLHREVGLLADAQRGTTQRLEILETGVHALGRTLDGVSYRLGEIESHLAKKNGVKPAKRKRPTKRSSRRKRG